MDVCPRCRQVGSGVIVKSVYGRKYAYFSHGEKKCYLGPAGNYVHVESLRSEKGLGYGLTNLSVEDPLDVAVNALLQFKNRISELDVSKREGRSRLVSYYKKIDAIKKLIEAIEKKLKEKVKEIEKNGV